MAKQLRVLYEDLESQVNIRTTQLVEINSTLEQQRLLLKEANWNSEKQIKAVSYSSPGQISRQMTDSSDCALPYSHELAEQFLAGNLFENFTQRDSRAFSRELKKICREIFGC